MTQKHIAYEFRRSCGCLRGAFVDTGHLAKDALAATLGAYLLSESETHVVRRELDDGELVSIGGPCPHSAVTE